jgi:broad specificity phosphatase PhoE
VLSSGQDDIEATPKLEPARRHSIVLARHGHPAVTAREKRAISGRDIGRWYRRYDELGIANESGPPVALRELAASAGCVVASDARRAIESAMRLTAAERIRVEPALREVGFPDSLGVPLKLSPGAWVMIARTVQLLDREMDERLADVRGRAAVAAERLARLAQDHGSVVAVGHGWFNQFVAMALRRRRWRGPLRPSARYWASASYEQ